MGAPANPRNLPQKAALAHLPSRAKSEAARAESQRMRGSRIEAATTMVSLLLGIASIGIAIWGLWVAADLPRYAETGILGSQQHTINAAISLLSWLVIFGPFLYLGIAILWPLFTPEKRTWLVPLRVFTYIVSLRAMAERFPRDFVGKEGEKTLPPHPPQKCLDLPPDSVRKDKGQ